MSSSFILASKYMNDAYLELSLYDIDIPFSVDQDQHQKQNSNRHAQHQTGYYCHRQTCGGATI